jgi:hypothetical protein
VYWKIPLLSLSGTRPRRQRDGLNLADPTPLLVFADWLEEQGDDGLAHAWRCWTHREQGIPKPDHRRRREYKG